MSTTRSAVEVPSDYLRVLDLDRHGLEDILELAAEMQAEPAGWLDAHAGASIACYFEKPSTRTRVSFEAAAQRLGALPIMLRPDELQLGRGEPVADTARVFSAYAEAIVIRTFSQDLLREVADAASVPVINALSDTHHPCQALADLLTMRQHFGRLAGLKLAYLGDANNVAHSLLEACATCGVDLSIACPHGYGPDADIHADAEWVARDSGATLEIVEDPFHAVAGADAVYTDVWVSMGEEAEQDRRLRDLGPYQVSRKLIDHAASGAIFMHCLPAHRGLEVESEVIDGPQSVVWDQAANRLPTEQAVLHRLISGHAR